MSRYQYIGRGSNYCDFKSQEVQRCFSVLQNSGRWLRAQQFMHQWATIRLGLVYRGYVISCRNSLPSIDLVLCDTFWVWDKSCPWWAENGLIALLLDTIKWERIWYQLTCHCLALKWLKAGWYVSIAVFRRRTAFLCELKSFLSTLMLRRSNWRGRLSYDMSMLGD